MPAPKTHFLFLITRIKQRSLAFLEAELARAGLEEISPAHGDILYVLHRNGPVSLKEIARHTRKDKSTVTGVVQRLEERGYLARERDPEDARVTRVKLTEKAAALAPRLFAVSNRLKARLFRGFSANERETLLRLLAKMERNG
jgi:DNA-binding MarR family transcriptional regulator